MITADKYYGSAAKRYDADRCHTLRWAREQLSVHDFVTDGPVLDVPVGTGRYVGILREKGLDVVGVDVSDDMLSEARARYPDLDARRGSVFDLPFEDGAFGTVICSRLLDWLSPTEMVRAVTELRRVARCLVVTIRHGSPRVDVNYTHDISRFYAVLEGLHIADRRVTETVRGDTEEMVLARSPAWSDVLSAVSYPDAVFQHPADEINRLAHTFMRREYRISPATLDEAAVKVSATFWSADQFGEMIDRLAGVDPDYRTDEPPRFNTNVAPVIMRREGKTFVLDGRRRSNAWMKQGGLHPVLMVDV